MGKMAVIYWSGTGNTEAMANQIADAARAKGAEVDLMEVSMTSAADAAGYEKLVLGCPAMGAEVLEEEVFEPFFTELEGKLGGRKVALFGSYGWGDGEWMRSWKERADAAGANVYDDGLMICGAPEAADERCTELGEGMANW